MYFLRKTFSFLFLGLIFIRPSFAEIDERCKNDLYRITNPEKCDVAKFNFAITPILSTGTVISGAIALLSLANTSSESNSNSHYIQPTLPSYDMVGGDISQAHLANTINNNNYMINFNQYNDIRLAYSIARGFTGKNVEIAILDAGLDSWHGRTVAEIASGPISPDAKITSYKIAKDLDFLPYEEIGNVIKSANTAEIFNASWSVTLSATALKSKNQLIQLTDKNFVDSISNAAKNDSIFVWAAGNDSRLQSSALSAMPIVIPELKGHFINVVAWDSSTGRLADYSNACGITKDYCITAPGTDINTGKTTASGTSFAAPIVSSAIAVIKEAFPYMSANEVTELLLTTARDIGLPGVDEIYGHGMLDLERATRPVGAPLVPLENGNTMQPLQTARVSGTIAHKIKDANLKFAYFDSFGRAFSANLSDNISIINPGRGIQKLREKNELATFSLNNLEFGFKNEDIILGNSFLQTEENNILSFIGTYNEIYIGNIKLFQRSRLGITAPKTTIDSMITKFSNIYTASFNLGAKINDWEFSFAIPDTIISGNMELRLPVGRATNRDIIYKNYLINLCSIPSIEYSISYKNLTASFIDNPYGKDEFFIMAKGNIKF